MRKAILNEKRQVVGFEPMEDTMSEKAQEQKKKQVDSVMKKFGFKAEK